jgi:hypothetical protein
MRDVDIATPSAVHAASATIEQSRSRMMQLWPAAMVRPVNAVDLER